MTRTACLRANSPDNAHHQSAWLRGLRWATYVDYSFGQIKLQFLELIDGTPNLNGKAYRTLVRLSLNWLDLGNGTWSMTLQALADDLGCSEATVSRSLRVIQRTGLLDIRLGTYGWATMLRVSDAAQAAATALPDKPGKIAGLERYQTEQNARTTKQIRRDQASLPPTVPPQ